MEGKIMLGQEGREGTAEERATQVELIAVVRMRDQAEHFMHTVFVVTSVTQ
jgi:hypothetical protein